MLSVKEKCSLVLVMTVLLLASGFVIQFIVITFRVVLPDSVIDHASKLVSILPSIPSALALSASNRALRLAVFFASVLQLVPILQ